MGGIFTKEQQEELRSFGQGIGAILTDRYQAKEAENFSATELARFNAETAAFNEILGTFQDPTSDELSNSFRQYQHNTLMPFITQASMKYANNPRVMQVVQQIKDANDQGFDQFMNIGKLSVAQRGVSVEEDREFREGEKQEAEEGRAQELHPLQKTHLEAQTELVQAQTGYYNRMPTGGKKGEEEPKTFADVLAAERSSKNATEKYKLDQRTMSDVISRIVTKNNGKLYPSKTGTWGSDPDKNQAEALDYLRQKDLLQDVTTAGRVAFRLGKSEEVVRNLYEAGLNVEALALVFPDLPIMENAEFGARAKIDDKVSDVDIVSVITGTPQSAAFNFSNLENFYEDAVDNMKSYNDLPPQLRQIFEVIKTDKLGNPVVEAGDPETGKIQTIPLLEAYSTKDNDISFQSALQNAARSMVLNPSVDLSSKKAKEVDEFLQKVIAKFLPQIIVEKSPALRERMSLEPESMLQMLRKTGIEFPRPVKKATELIKKGSKKALSLIYDSTEENAGS